MKAIAIVFGCLAQFSIAQSAIDSVAVTKSAMPAVVRIVTDRDSSGSGIVISPDGMIVTALHVVRGASDAHAITTGGESYRIVQVLSFDTERDLAIIKVEAANLSILKLSESDDVSVGEPVLVIGYPLGLREASVTMGIVSAVHRDAGLIQTSAAVNHGDSGGPLLNARGKIIGIIEWKASNAENLGFATLITYLRGMLASEMHPISLAELKTKLPLQAGGETAAETLGLPRYWKSASGPERFEVRMDGDFLYADRQIFQNAEGSVFEKIDSKKSGSLYVGSLYIGAYGPTGAICTFTSQAEFTMVTKTRIEGAMLMLRPGATVTVNPCYSEKPTRIVRFVWVPE